jgi:coenzyme F420 hydrogenase subunit beta
VWARLKGIEAADLPVPVVSDLEIDECARLNSLKENLVEYRGARDRVKRGRLGEPTPVERGCP